MIRTSALFRVLKQNLRRNLRHLALSSFGIVVGIAAFVFFWGLSQGVSRVVLHDIFPIDRLEVISPKTTLTGIPVALDDALVQKILARPEVRGAYPKMKLAFPAKGWGRLLGSDLAFEVGGFTDGIEPELTKNDPGGDVFRDWELEEKGKEAACGPEPGNVCPADYYCGWDRLCHHRVPVLVSRTLLEMYNGSFAPAHGLPRIGSAQEAVLKGRLRTMRFTIGLGESLVRATNMKVNAPPSQVEAMLVGISDKAMPIGMTMPIGYIRRWNQKYAGDAAANAYSSIVVDLKDKDDIAEFVPYVKSLGFETEESQAERIALVITVVTLLFLVIAFVICFISAVNIAHTFFMMVSERRREIGLMRALGASRADVWKIILSEAAVVGVVGGVLGVGVALAAARLIDWYSARNLPDFPFKPTTYFVFSWELLVAALLFAVLFCVLGAALPARKAARIHPAAALSG
jgi:putative ABC transport system permease protein